MQVGDNCSFYHEGGHGDRHWIVGWRFGIIRAVPTKGAKKNWMHIEIPVRMFTVENDRWKQRPPQRFWVHSSVVNAVGDFKYHGLKLAEAVKERKETKIKQQKKADKRKRPAK